MSWSRAFLRHAGQDFLQKRWICVTDEIVLMGSASSLTHPREKQREEEAAGGVSGEKEAGNPPYGFYGSFVDVDRERSSKRYTGCYVR